MYRFVLKPAALKKRLAHHQQKLMHSPWPALLCSVAAGLLPPLLWLLLVIVWQLLPAAPTLDARPFTLAALLLCPFAAGFAHNRQKPSAGGAAPAFCLWLGALAVYCLQFGLPATPALLLSLAGALLLGLAGGMSAKRITALKHKKIAEA